MSIDILLLIFVLSASGIWLLLEGEFKRILLGFLLLSSAMNLVLLAMSKDPSGRRPPVLLEGVSNEADPLPQALVLTAIVIGFAVSAYLVTLLYRTSLDQGVSSLEELDAIDSLAESRS